ACWPRSTSSTGAGTSPTSTSRSACAGRASRGTAGDRPRVRRHARPGRRRGPGDRGARARPAVGHPGHHPPGDRPRRPRRPADPPWRRPYQRHPAAAAAAEAGAAAEAEHPAAREGGPVSDEPLLLSAADAARALGISERHLYDLLDEGALPEVRLGRRRLVPRRALDLLVERAMAGFDPAALADRIAAHSAAA